MIQSMTGFSIRTSTIPFAGTSVTLTFTLKSVNGRYFEATCKLPYAFNHLEPECNKLLKAQLVRGSIYLTVYASQPTALKGALRPNLSIAKSYLDGLKEIQKTYQVPGDISIQNIATLPNIFETSDDLINDATNKAFIAELHPLIADLIAERAREGQALEQDILSRVALLKKYIHEVKPRAHEVIAARKQTLLKELEPLLAKESDESREHHLSAIFGQLEKMDIHEEMVRFSTHLENFEAIILNNDLEKGKRLDFTLQELFREINTMAAKCSDAQISSLTIAMKVEVEKAREQVQNII